MKRWMTTAMVVGVVGAVYVGGSAGPAGALTPVCIGGFTGNGIAWLVDAKCQCTNPSFTPKEREECAYESQVLQCEKTVGLTVDCAALPKLPQRESSNGRFWSSIDLTTLTTNCGQQQQLHACIRNLNVAGSGPTGPYRDPPVSGEFRPLCNAAPPPCNVPTVDTFDPCGTRSCNGAGG